MSSAEKKILLTGGAGFIGKNLLENLSGKYQILAPGHKELDLLDPEALERFFNENKIDAVVHAAGVGASRAEARDGVFEKNKNIFLNLVANKAKFERLIFLGSGAEYDKSRPLVKIKESDFGKFEPQDEYGRSKYFASQRIAQMDNAVNLRCFGIFGKYEDYTTRFISNAICHALFNRPILLRQNVRFSYIYVNDLVRIIEHFIDHEAKHKFYNISNGQIVEVLQLAEMVKAATGGGAEIKILNPGFKKEYSCDFALLKEELGDFKFTPFQAAIDEMVLWYKNNLASIDVSKLEFDAK